MNRLRVGLRTLPLSKLVNAAVGFALVGSALVLPGAVPSDRARTNGTRSNQPNIVFILADDLDQHSVAYMPNVQRLLVNQGTTFANCFVNVSSCCPSRASILRGQYSHNHRVYANVEPYGGFARFHQLGLENSTIATWLQAAGYRTVLLGKYLNNYPRGAASINFVPPGWTEWYAVNGLIGHYFNYAINQNGKTVHYGDRPEDYETDVLTRLVVDFIKHKESDEPFFAYFAPVAPHDDTSSTPPIPAPRHAQEFAHLNAPRNPSFNEIDVNDKPSWVRESVRLNDSKVATVDENYRMRLRSLLAVDDMVKVISDTLEALQLLDKTYIFFTSDNGYMYGEHRKHRGKSSAFEEAIHVPLIVRGPDVPAGRTLEHFVFNIDFAPTFAELAGIMAPDFVDGLSFAILLQNEVPPLSAWQRPLLVQHWALVDNGIPPFQGIRNQRYLYVEYPETGEIELYDMWNDPYQLQSLHATASPEVLARLAAELDTLRECTGGGCIVLTLQDDEDRTPPASLELEQNYPNPFNPGTRIRFLLSKGELATLKVLDLQGREVRTLLQTWLPAGEHNVAFDATGLKSGFYLIRLVTPSASQTRKAVLVH